jgi:GMP synthase (glutamine-hydrolysing)
MKNKLNIQTILILDFGSQYSQLIARRVREAKVYCEILPYSISIEKILEYNPKGIILSGGPRSVYEKDAPLIDKKIFNLGIPIFGICYGMQLIAHLLDGKVSKAEKHEYGKTELFVVEEEKILFKGLNPHLICWMSHSDIVSKLPKSFKILAYTHNCPIAAMADSERKIYAVQFHPEVAHTPWGIEIIKNFLYNICKCEPTWTMKSFITTKIQEIKKIVKEEKVICALSGGVDSATTAALVYKAIGNKLYCIFVNHGFLRKEEPERVRKTFTKNFKMNLIYVDAKDRFLKKLKGITDPEEKRKIIGNEFIKIFEEEAKKIGDIKFLAQGTLYPDVIESQATNPFASRIKTHHNVGGLPERMKFKLIEPLRNLFKDEVREVAEELGLPPEITYRQPFPGPGLAIRIIGEITEERLEILREADWIVVDEIKKAGLYNKMWQFFAILPVIKTVGVMGDRRTYKYPIVLRAVTSEDGMTADWARLPYEVLERISNRIVNEVKEVNRLVYDISSKPPSTIEWE